MTYEVHTTDGDASEGRAEAWNTDGIKFPNVTPGTVEHTALTVFGVAVKDGDTVIGEIPDREGKLVEIQGRPWATERDVVVYIDRGGGTESSATSLGLVPHEGGFGHLVMIDGPNGETSLKLVREARPEPREDKQSVATGAPNPYAIEVTNPDWRNETPGDGRGAIALPDGFVPPSGVVRAANTIGSGVYHVGGDRYSHTPPPDQAHM